MISPGCRKVSVVMPVFNGGKYLREAIQSVLDQTFTDFELIVIDDGSSDDSYDIAAAFSDPRIRLVREAENMGVVAALNRGVALAHGELIARMDADDVCLPNRLSQQVKFMDANPTIAICGSWMHVWGEKLSETWSVPLTHDSIKSRLLFQSALFHPTVVIRTSIIDDRSLLYLKEFEYAEDYDLWSRCAACFTLGNIGEILLHYRIHGHSIGSLEPESKQDKADLVRLRWLRQLGLQPTDDELGLHRQISLVVIPTPPTYDFLETSHQWLLQLRNANAVAQTFTEPEFTLELSERWFLLCNRSTSLGLPVLIKFLRSPLANRLPMGKTAFFAFAFKCIFRYQAR